MRGILPGLQIYVESYHIVPKGVCRNLVKYMAWCFYISWVGFPIIFVAGPDGLGKLSIWAEVAGSQPNPKPYIFLAFVVSMLCLPAVCGNVALVL